MTAAEIRVTCAERKVDLGLSPWRRPSCQRPMDFICASTLTLSFQGLGENLNMVNVFVLFCQSTCCCTISLWCVLGWVSFGKQNSDENGAVQRFHYLPGLLFLYPYWFNICHRTTQVWKGLLRSLTLIVNIALLCSLLNCVPKCIPPLSTHTAVLVFLYL